MDKVLSVKDVGAEVVAADGASLLKVVVQNGRYEGGQYTEDQLAHQVYRWNDSAEHFISLQVSAPSSSFLIRMADSFKPASVTVGSSFIGCQPFTQNLSQPSSENIRPARGTVGHSTHVRASYNPRVSSGLLDPFVINRHPLGGYLAVRTQIKLLEHEAVVT